MDWLDLLEVQGTVRSLFQHHSSKASILQCSTFFIVQLSHPYMITEKTIALTRWTFIGKVMSLLFNTLSRLVIAFLPRSKSLLISRLQLPPAVISDPQKTKPLIASAHTPTITFTMCFWPHHTETLESGFHFMFMFLALALGTQLEHSKCLFS